MSKFFPHMPVGVRGGLVDWKHVERMDRAVFLFLWAVLRQTGSGKDGRGVVNYGKPVTIGQIADEIRAPYATIRKWLARLEEYGYLKRASFADNSFALFVCSEKKFHKNPQYRDRPYTDGDSDRIRTETPTIYDHRLASKPKKTFGFTPPNVKDIRKECKELRPDEPAESLPLLSHRVRRPPRAPAHFGIRQGAHHRCLLRGPQPPPLGPPVHRLLNGVA